MKEKQRKKKISKKLVETRGLAWLHKHLPGKYEVMSLILSTNKKYPKNK